MKNLKKDVLMNLLALNLDKAMKKDKTLGEQMVYAIKNEKKATKRDVLGLLEQARELLGGKFITHVLAEEKPTPKKEAKPKAEASLKPKKKIAKKSKEEPKEEPKTKKKATKKTSEKKTEKKEEPKKSAKKSTKKEKFPETLKIGKEKYTATNEFDGLESVHKALEEGKEIVFAFHWNKTSIKKQYPSFLGKPKEFENDLDLCVPIYVSDEFKVMYLVSMYTELIYHILPKEKKSDELLEKNYQVYIKK